MVIQNTNFGALTIPSFMTDNFFCINDWLNLSSNFTSDRHFFDRLLNEMNSILKETKNNPKTNRNNIYIEGNNWIDSSAKLLPGVTIIGPCIIGANSIIGPNSYLRPGTIVGKGVRLGFCAETNSSIFFDSSNMRHVGYTGKSIIGESTIIGAGTIFATLRLDKDYITFNHPKGPIRSMLFKAGSFVEKDVRVGLNVSIMPGTWIRKSNEIFPKSIINGLI